MCDDQVFVAVLISVNENRLERVVLVSQTGFFCDVFKRVVAVVDEQATVSAVAFLVEDVVTFNVLFLDVAANVHVKVTVAIQVRDCNRKRCCVIVQFDVEFLTVEFAIVICVQPNAVLASHNEIVVTVMINVQRRRTHAAFRHVFFGESSLFGDVFEIAVLKTVDHIALILTAAKKQFFGAVIEIKRTATSRLNLTRLHIVVTHRQFDFGVLRNADALSRNVVGDRRIVTKANDDKQRQQAHQREHDDGNPFQIGENGPLLFYGGFRFLVAAFGILM